ncbi:MAG: PIN domain-containing protein [Methanoregula sp.]|nr:PIN domain-containing protein [Methanoregula sp.]
MPVADTSFIVDLMRKDPGALECYQEYEEQGIALFTTGITALELYKGAFVSGSDDNRIKVQKILELFVVIPIDDPVYETFGRLAAGLCRKGNPVGDFDEVIAAITLLADKKIITRDRHFEKIPNISLITY